MRAYGQEQTCCFPSSWIGAGRSGFHRSTEWIPLHLTGDEQVFPALAFRGHLRLKGGLKMNILAINPNTTEAMTETVLAALRTHAGDALSFEGATASRGTAVVASRASYAIAAVSTLEVWAA